MIDHREQDSGSGYLLSWERRPGREAAVAVFGLRPPIVVAIVILGLLVAAFGLLNGSVTPGLIGLAWAIGFPLVLWWAGRKAIIRQESPAVIVLTGDAVVVDNVGHHEFPWSHFTHWTVRWGHLILVRKTSRLSWVSVPIPESTVPAADRFAIDSLLDRQLARL